MADYILQAKNIYKSYQQGSGSLPILKGLNLYLRKGEALCILGSSGSGKSTFLQILGTLDRPSQGELFFENQNLLKMSDEELSAFRNQKMGFVFQFHHLISEFTAMENVMMPARIAGDSHQEAMLQAEELLRYMGLLGRAHHYPSELSGGELQRVAIARALVRKPQILFADEPTGNLDSANGKKVQELFFELRQKLGLTLVVVTHDLQFAQQFPKILKLKDGLWV